MKNKFWILGSSVVVIFLVLGAFFYKSYATAPVTKTPEPSPKFDGQKAYQDVVYQVTLGPRTPGSPAHDNFITWASTELIQAGWMVEYQKTEMLNHPIRNIIASRGEKGPWLIIGAHYDSRMFADHDTDQSKRTQPVPGANDGASGAAVLLELARSLPVMEDRKISLVFFDAEDQGRIKDWNWILGSRAYANALTTLPDAVVIVDMIGDKDLNVFIEKNSNTELVEEIWGTAEKLGYGEKIISTPKFSMLDDHTPFLEKGIKAVDLIDFDYPSWHTTLDTADKVSPDSLEVIGNTLWHWITDYR